MINLPAHEHLDRLTIPYERREFSPETEKGAANVAHALGFRERQMVKTLVFEAAGGERVLVMVGGDQNAVSGFLKKAIGSKDIRMASLDAVKETTGYVVGSVPPFGWQPPGFRTFVDAALMDEEVLGVGTGQWGHEILISPSDLVRASGARVVNLTDRDRPAPGSGA
ncbi:MAG TPA: YbaK/EbsC family protein [Longimicrobiaceae bacterium]|jgi:Cys-tRNA(Pro)/Cys-tRNA(Cys) deacylase|nr:YbaK/EbsC family protein [Longimicrobiaceae bacterium]